MNPLLSIITPAYNSERFIAETINSVILQTYQNWEHLVVIDNNSGDKTEEIVKKYELLDSRVKCIKSADAYGAANNRNIALNLSRGEYIAFIDSDDVWLPNKLQVQLDFMKNNNCEFTYHSYQRMNEKGEPIGEVLCAPKTVSYGSLLKNNSIGCLTVMLKADLAKSTRFQEFGWEDMAFWLDLLREGKIAMGIQQSLALYRIVKGSRSNNKIFSAGLRWQTYRICAKLPLHQAIFYFLYYTLSGVKKHLFN